MFRKLGMFDRSLGMFQPPGSIPYPGPQSLFANGEQGVWYDPSDFSTMFQDSAGTTPVTAIEQPVGLILDKSGRGNHAAQSTTTSRPILRNLYNLLQYTEQFDNAAWTKSGTTVTQDAVVAPNGTTTADLIIEDSASSGHTCIYFGSIASGGLSTTVSVALKNAGAQWVRFSFYEGTTSGGEFRANFDLINGVAGNAGRATGTGTFISSSISDLGDGWYRCSMTFTQSSNAGGSFTNFNIISLRTLGNISTATGSTTYQGNGSNLFYAWGASLVPANEASLPYQRVVTNTLGSGVYDTDLTKFKPYLFFDGTDDCLFTGAVDFSATDVMSVFAGIRKLSDAKQQPVVELSATIASNNGTFLLSAPHSAAANYNFSSKGTSQVDNTVTTYAAPITNVVTGLADISTPFNTIRVNGAATAVTTSQGTGNYGAAYPLYIGRRNNADASLIWTGRIYSLIIRGALTSGTQLTQTESWVYSKTGAY